MTAPTHMRLTRYVDGRLVDSELSEVGAGDITGIAENHGVWMALCENLGMDWSVVIDDPETEVVLVEIDAELRSMGPMAYAVRIQEGLQRIMKARGDA